MDVRVPETWQFWDKDWRVWRCAAELFLVSAWVARHFLNELRQMGLFSMDKDDTISFQHCSRREDRPYFLQRALEATEAAKKRQQDKDTAGTAPLRQRSQTRRGALARSSSKDLLRSVDDANSPMTSPRRKRFSTLSWMGGNDPTLFSLSDSHQAGSTNVQLQGGRRRG